MSRTNQVSRGQPLVALAAIMGGWVALRIVFWDGAGYPFQAQHSEGASPPVRVSGAVESLATGQAAGIERDALASDGKGTEVERADAGSAWKSRPAPADVPFVPSSGMPEPESVSVSAGHHMLWMAALANVPMPVQVSKASLADPAPEPFYPATGKVKSGDRWSADGWLLLRRGGKASLSTGAAPATYGASQAGAVVRYRIDPANSRKPTTYLRGTAALNGAPDKEAALGLSMRPIASIPLVAAAELRASDQYGGTSLRPAAMVVTELQPIDLPLGTRAEFYGQAGYVGGKFETGFVDAQLRVDKQVLQFGKGNLRAGGGAWGGAQKGASRVDVGPTAIMGLPVGKDGSARVAFDWRIRVGGNARPDSGPAVTLSAGF